MLFLRRLEAFNLTQEPRWNVASGHGNNADSMYTRDEPDNPPGQVNPHYRLLREQNEALKSSLNTVVKYTESIAEPAPSLGAVGHASAAPDAPRAGLRWKHPYHEPRQNTGINSCATKLGHGV